MMRVGGSRSGAAPRARPSWPVYRRLLGFARPYARRLVAAGLLLLVSTALTLAWPQFVQRIIDGDEVRSPIIAQAHVGASMAPARGLSIYFPLFLDRSAFYRELDFARATRWADVLDAYLGTGRSGDAR